MSVETKPVGAGGRVPLPDAPEPKVISPSTPSLPTQTLPSLAPRRGAGWEQQRDRLRKLVAENPIQDISQEELDAHFNGMPSRYWEQVDESELIWGLQNVHRFLYGVVASPSADTPVVVNWRYFKEQGYTKVLVCTWDRMGLLAKVAGYISALHLNVVRAEVYTRADNLVLDSFWLCNAEQEHVSDPERLRQFVFLLEGGLSESPSFASTWALETHKYLPRMKRIVPAVAFNNLDSAEHTIVTVEASERPGLLHDMLKVLGDNKLNISEALIDTVDEVAHDIFFLTDERRSKVLAEDRLMAIEHRLIEAVM
ncbi:MAG TPA: ACT domain-containing protein [Candidatus Limnocylindria bacterium]|nr:ACT domain-containing protein [Candidatus Limnocylindria bacterium]